MKKFFLIVNVLIGLSSYGQITQVAKNMVLLEIATGTWCGYCPGAAMAADQMVAEGLNVAVIENHGNDSYQTQGSVSRINYYGITAYPTAYFNGTINHIGGGTSNIYSTYKPIYNKSVVETTGFSFKLTVAHISDNNYNAKIEVTRLAYYPNDTIKLHIIITESEIQQNWQGQTHLSFVNRMQVTKISGNELCLSCSGTYTFNMPFTISDSWNIHNLEAVAFIQDDDTKEVLQVDKKPIPQPVVKADVSLTQINGTDLVMCDNSIVPSIVVKNNADITLANLTVNYWVNSNKKNIFRWEGECLPYQSVEIALPEFEFFGNNGMNDFMVEIEKPNGIDDENPGDERRVISFFQATQKTRFLEIETNTDHNGEETNWSISNGAGEVLYSKGQFESGRTYRDYFELENNQCFSFNLYDSGQNGFSDGSVRLIDYYSQKEIMAFQNFESDTAIPFRTEYAAGKTFLLKDMYNEVLGNGEVLYNYGYAGDSVIDLMLKLENQTPIEQQLKMTSKYIQGNQQLKQQTNWPETDTLNLPGLQASIFNAYIAPQNLVDSCLVKYTIWADNDTVDKFEFFIWHIARLQPPVKFVAYNINQGFLHNADTLRFSGYVKDLDISQNLWLINESSIPVGLKVKKSEKLANGVNPSVFSWGNHTGIEEPVSLNATNILPADTNKTFSFQFRPNKEGVHTINFTFFNENNPTDSLLICYLVEAKPDPNWVLKVKTSDGSELTHQQDINLEFFENDTSEKEISLILNSTSRYPIKVSLKTEPLVDIIRNGIKMEWNKQATDFLSPKNFDTLTIDPQIQVLGPVFTMIPPYSIETGSVKFGLYNPETANDVFEGFITYNILADTTQTNGVFLMSAMENLKVYPNPANEKIFVGFGEEVLDGNPPFFKLSILNSMGQKILTSDHLSFESGLEVAGLKSGLYYVVVETDSNVFFGKMIKL